MIYTTKNTLSFYSLLKKMKAFIFEDKLLKKLQTALILFLLFK